MTSWRTKGVKAGATAVDHALDAFSTALDQLVRVVEAGGLDGYDDLGLVAFARRLEAVRNRVALIDHRLVRDGEARRLPETLTRPSMAAVLRWALRIAPGEAARRARAAEHLERHHVVAWADGGRTDLDNLTLLCGYHHHFAGRGWTWRMIDGLPAWTPPRWVDPRQKPLLNTRIAARIAGGPRRERLRC